MGRRLALLLVLLAALASCGKRRVDPFLRWYSLGEGEARARREQKPMLVFVHADWSHADAMLERETFPADDVRRELRDVVAISVDATDDEDPALRPIRERFRVVGVPTILLLAPDGRELVRMSEFVTHDKLAGILRDARTAPPLEWHDPVAGEALARAEHKRVVLFFGAAWSKPDVELERETFPNPAVRRELADFVLIKVDLTEEENAVTDRMKARFKVVGDPTTLILRTIDGPELARFHEYVAPPTMAAALATARRR